MQLLSRSPYDGAKASVLNRKWRYLQNYYPRKGRCVRHQAAGFEMAFEDKIDELKERDKVWIEIRAGGLSLAIPPGPQNEIAP